MSRLLNSTSPIASDSSGNATASKDLKVEGKFGANGATPVGKAASVSTLNTSIGAGVLLTEVITLLNATNKAVNEIATTLKNAGLMS